jgi:hypothetical protein
MSTLAIDTRKLLTALKATGKGANFTAEEIADAVDAAQQGAELLTRSEFNVRMDAFSVRMHAMEVKFDATLHALRAEIKAEIRASQLQNLMWLSGILLASNAVVIALLGRLAHVY